MADTSVHPVDDRIRYNLDSSLAELSALCAQPSISARNEGMQETADLLTEMLRRRGLRVRLMPTPGSPVVYAEGGAGDTTLLLYNHYDVQPPEPLELWDTPPFRPTVRDGKLYARGVADDKGEIACRLAAIDAVLEAYGELPCRIKMVVEGEEEIGSVNLPRFVEEHAELLKADACLWEGGGVDFTGRPAIMLGMRGLLYVDFHVRTIAFDGHSGKANLFPNAAWRLMWALSTLKGRDERVLIDGFYDDVVPPTERDLELLAASVDGEQQRREQRMMGVDRYLGGKEGLEAAALVFEPTANIAGLQSGYNGDGAKTIIPGEARAKMDFRLVPNQNPHHIAHLLRAHLDARGFDDVTFTVLGAEFPGKTGSDNPYVQMCIRAAEDVYGTPCRVSPLVGGTGPIYPFVEILGTPILTAGCGTPTAMVHAPNENLSLEAFVMGAQHIARLILGMRLVGEEQRSGHVTSQ